MALVWAKYSSTEGSSPGRRRWPPVRPTRGTRWASAAHPVGEVAGRRRDHGGLRAPPGPGSPCTASTRGSRCGRRRRRRCCSSPPAELGLVHLGRRGDPQPGRRPGRRLAASSCPAARKWPMLVMHDPMNTSSIGAAGHLGEGPDVVGIVRAGEERLGDRRHVDLDDGCVAGVGVGPEQGRVGEPSLHGLGPAFERAGVLVAGVDEPAQQRDVRAQVAGPPSPRRGRSCSRPPSARPWSRTARTPPRRVRSCSPSISMMRPLNTFCLPWRRA